MLIFPLPTVRNFRTVPTLMSEVAAILEAFGGVRPAARALGAPHSTVMSWKKAGVIPARRQKHLLATAASLGLRVTAASFFPNPSPGESSTGGEAAKREPQVVRPDAPALNPRIDP